MEHYANRRISFRHNCITEQKIGLINAIEQGNVIQIYKQ
jgi:hypothetical protein